MEKAYYNSPIGTLEICGTEAGISAVSMLDEKHDNSYSFPSCIEECIQQLDRYFSSGLREFRVRLNPAGTDFQKQVWEELVKIPYGTTSSYMALAKKLGDVKKIRAVGMANGRNPIGIIIPCHRVIGSDGTLVGYAGGLWRKKWLLEHEGVLSKAVQTDLFDTAT